jgi:OPA family sugar phosphate sensor protein UhpC-like MFS transporter
LILPAAPHLGDVSCAVSIEPTVPLPRALHVWRIRIFISTWICYAGLYFCRHAFYMAKGDLTEKLGIDAGTLGTIGLIYLAAYALGEFNSAAVGSRVGPRRLLLAGMAVSLSANIAFGFATSARTFMIFMALNGVSQATGWSGNIGTLAHWFRQQERGRVMGVWSTCYQIGGALARGFAAFMLGIGGLRWGFWGGASVLAAVWIAFFIMQRNRPEDVGLPALDDAQEQPEQADARPSSVTTPTRLDAGLLLTIGLMGCFYFFVKLVRYALWSWAPYFLQLHFKLPKNKAGYFSTIFDICGFIGVIVAGFLSDLVFGGRRAVLSLLLIVGLAASTVLLWLAGANSLPMFGLSIGLIGFCLYGPDSLISGAGAIDVGSRKYAIAAAGMINGMGSLGPVLQEVVIGNMYKNNPGDLASILGLLTGAAVVATVLMGLLVLRARQGKCNL